MNLKRYGIAEGHPASLLVLDAPDVNEALRFHAPPRMVINRGAPIDLAKLKGLAGL